ncbi:nucleolus and neural progenitor protein isoform X2 [Takifugu flavidus]|uniref:nucleolus and neural progenitor protein isoform X2 n=1 Tax=Takifugu flavidus TaxID=433684 RepID=UPI0025449920|nr:nucleolus and neural progenitor protein isoform X2 [Takifugu flavidus]
MAGEPWNRVHIPFPSAVSTVRIPFTSTTDSRVKAVLAEKDKVLKLIGSELLQTEIRVMYELLYILNNSYRGNKTFKGVKQVEQCINRLKMMKLEAALQDLTELCPDRIQRRAGEWDAPSQPFLEWLCLKVLGGGQLMSCSLSRCSRAFMLSKQQMKLEEFVILNVVITSMVSRLWVICRGILASLSSLYQHLLQLLGEVAEAHPMSFLKEFSLPVDMSQFLPPSDAFLQARLIPQRKKQQEVQQGVKRKANEDLGVSINRALERLHGE